MAQPCIFISHAHADRELAGNVREMLQAALTLRDDEIVCTSDGNYDLDSGGDLKQQLMQRLQSATAFFLLASEATRGKDWVGFECGVATQIQADEKKLELHILTPT